MDKEFELRVCKGFFDKNKWERIYYELSSDKKRENFFRKMSHTAEEYLGCVISDSFKMPPDIDRIEGFLKCRECYFIVQENGDGKFLNTREALSELYRLGTPYMAVTPDCTLAYLETEYDFSDHKAYFLKAE